MISRLERLLRSMDIFPFLLVFRWITLAAPLWSLLHEAGTSLLISPLWIFGLVLLVNGIISLFYHILNRWTLEHPLLMGIDLLFCALILTLSGGSNSPYYLYTISPLLAAAFFFQLRGALISAGAFTILYLLADLLAQRLYPSPAPSNLSLTTQLVSIWLFPLLLAYPSILIHELNKARDALAAARDELTEQNKELANAHHQLRLVHDLTVLLQGAADLPSVEQRVLSAIVNGLGFHQAILGIVTPGHEEIGHWKLHPVNSSFPHVPPIPLNRENGALLQALIEQKTLITSPEDTLIHHPLLNSWLRTARWYVHPLFLREHTIGILLVELEKNQELTKSQESILKMVANQAALSLGTTLLCIDRAQRLAIETERNRIAREMHDSIAQSLFGIIYSLSACIQMLPEHPEKVRQELSELLTLATNVHQDVRRSIFDLWPSTLTSDRFQQDLQNYVDSFCRPRHFKLIFDIKGDFDHLPSGLRRSLYRIAQEAVANAARHSGVDCAKVCLMVANGEVHLMIVDEGRGFDPAIALERSLNREHFGLRGIQERARALGGDCEIQSQPGAGTRILVHLPLTSPSHG
ncbi:MAG: GAF domain-containing sensor histidine kinase [Chloroflexi bacterium]|nr:GAF domain-containing sensor histidine kinase [Chloroflexota bacterium]